MDGKNSTYPGRIFLVGFMGAGKSYLGRQLADRFGLPFADLDHLVETEAGATISEFFRAYGEPPFRILESNQLRTFSETYSTFVLATGGGTPCYRDNMAYMNRQGTTVYLDTEPALLAQRLRPEIDHRPLLHGHAADLEAFIDRRLRERLPTYRQAQIVQRVAADTDPLPELVARLKTHPLP